MEPNNDHLLTPMPLGADYRVPPENPCRSIGGGIDGWVIDGVLSEEECKGIIDICEKVGYYGIDHLYTKEKRNNDRSFIVSRESAELLFRRVLPYLHQTAYYGAAQEATWDLEGMEEVFRVNRYLPGKYFKGHYDTPYSSGDDVRSFYSILFYLNTVPEEHGGRTVFLGSEGQVVAAVQPVAGRVAIFNHQSLHSGELLTAGTKHAMRSDIVYSKRPPPAPVPSLLEPRLSEQTIYDRLKAGANPNEQDSDGNTILHNYCARKRGGPPPGRNAPDRIISALLAAGANPNIQNNAGNTPAHHAANGRQRDVINKLKSYGADGSGAALRNFVADLSLKNNAGKDVFEAFKAGHMRFD